MKVDVFKSSKHFFGHFNTLETHSDLLYGFLWIGSVCGPCDERFIGSFLIALQVWWMCNGRDDGLLLFKGTSKNASRRRWKMFWFLNWVFGHSWKVSFSLGFLFLSTSYNWVLKTSRLFGLILLRLLLISFNSNAYQKTFF